MHKFMGVDRIDLVQKRDKRLALVSTVMNLPSGSIKFWVFSININSDKPTPCQEGRTYSRQQDVGQTG
jgi:hypothetical protein